MARVSAGHPKLVRAVEVRSLCNRYGRYGRYRYGRYRYGRYRYGRYRYGRYRYGSYRYGAPPSGVSIRTVPTAPTTTTTTATTTTNTTNTTTAVTPKLVRAVETLLKDRCVLSQYLAYARTPGSLGTGAGTAQTPGFGAHYDYKPWRPVGSFLRWLFVVVPLDDYTGNLFGREC